MTGLLDDLVEPFVRVDPAAVAALLADEWGIEDARLTLLETERDDTFRVDTDRDTVLVKVAHPNDGAALLDLQDSALSAVAQYDPALPVPHVIPAHSGERVTLDGRIVRVLSWLPGTPAGRDRMPLRLGGELLGRLSRSLAHLEHPTADRVLPWDLRHVPALAAYTDDPVIRAAIERFAVEVSPALDALPRQIVHSDFHPENVLVNEAGTITGVIDFGDVVRTPRVCDVGVALGYLVPEDATGDEVRAEFLAGFESIVPLSDAERSIVPGLVVGRQIQRILINEELCRRTGQPAWAPRLRRLFEQTLNDWK